MHWPSFFFGIIAVHVFYSIIALIVFLWIIRDNGEHVPTEEELIQRN